MRRSRQIGVEILCRSRQSIFGAGQALRPAAENLAVARAKGKLRGKQPKLSARQQLELARMAGTGEYTIADLAEVFTVSRATVYRTLQRSPASPAR